MVEKNNFLPALWDASFIEEENFFKFLMIFLVCPAWLSITKTIQFFDIWTDLRSLSSGPVFDGNSNVRGSRKSAGKEKTPLASCLEPSSFLCTTLSCLHIPRPSSHSTSPGTPSLNPGWTGAPLSCSGSNHRSPDLSGGAHHSLAGLLSCPSCLGWEGGQSHIIIIPLK